MQYRNGMFSAETSTGDDAMTSHELRSAIAKPGYWFVNIAPLGSDPDWVEQIMPPDQDLNDDRLFGIGRTEFMRKQYR